MSKVIIKNVECYGNIQDADCILVSTCEDSFTISPSKNWTETVNDLLKDDNHLISCAKNGELQLEVDSPISINQMFTNAININAIDNLSKDQLDKVADILGVK